MTAPVTALLAACALLLAACQSLPPEPAPDSPPDPASLRLITVERAYTLEDPRDFEFKTRIAAEAATACGSAGHRVITSRPVGTEQIGEDFLTRLYEIEIACTPAP